MTYSWVQDLSHTSGYPTYKYVTEYYQKPAPMPHFHTLVYHGEPTPLMAFFCGHHDILLPEEYCNLCDLAYTLPDPTKPTPRENTAWQTDLVIVTPCNWEKGGWQKHNLCPEDEHHWFYDLHIFEADIYTQQMYEEFHNAA